MPSPEAATGLFIWIPEDVANVDGEIINVAWATMPFATLVVLIPKTMQLVVPGVEPAAHLTLLPALVADGPATTLTPVKTDVEYENAHCREAGCVPAELSETLNATELPGVPFPDDKLIDT